VLDPSSSWNTGSTKIWFKTQAAISANSSDENYYLYHGNASAGSPPADGLNVYLFHDDFPGSAVDTSKWTVTRGTATVSSGILTLNSGGSIWATPTYGFGVNTRWEARTQLGGDGSEDYFDYWAATDQDGFIGDWIVFWTTATNHYAETDATGNESTPITVSTPTSYHVYAFL